MNDLKKAWNTPEGRRAAIIMFVGVLMCALGGTLAKGNAANLIAILGAFVSIAGGDQFVRVFMYYRMNSEDDNGSGGNNNKKR